MAFVGEGWGGGGGNISTKEGIRVALCSAGGKMLSLMARVVDAKPNLIQAQRVAGRDW